MLKLPLLMLSVIAGCAALYACGSSNSGDDDDGIIPYDAGPDVKIIFDTGVDGPSAAAGMGKAFCDATLGLIQNDIGQCCAPAEKTGLATDLYKNIDTYVTQCETTLENSIAQRRTAPNAADYAACENAYKAEFTLPPATNACQGLDAYRPGDVLSVSCAGAFVGVGVVNSPCSGDFDCSNGFACIGYAPGTDGTCQALVPADGTCGPGTSTTAPAVDFVLPPIESCASNFYCAAGTCKATFATGATCATDPECGTGNACIDTLCVTANPDGTRLPTGMYCTASADCIEGDYCLSESTCDPASPPCVPKDDGGAPPAATGVCTPSIATGACTSTNAHECQGTCTGAACAKLCTWPQ